MKLGIDFIIYSSLLISMLLPLYIFRQKIFKFLYKPSDFETFLTELKKYTNNNHAYIDFDYSIVEKTKNEENPKARQILIVENMLMQFTQFEINISTQNSVEKELLWQTYEADAFPNKDKLPKDWLRRKETVLKRDNHTCSRCGLKIGIHDSQVYAIRDINNGGTYHFENLLTVCNDCNRIINAKDIGKVVKSLNITDALMHKVIG